LYIEVQFLKIGSFSVDEENRFVAALEKNQGGIRTDGTYVADARPLTDPRLQGCTITFIYIET
jgi:hypothetical protein